MKKEKTAPNIRSITLCSLFAALIAAGAFIMVPVGIVPMTLQLLFTNLSGLLLGKKRGMLSVAAYIALGLLGVPVFTGGGGFAYVLQPTFGYLLGMLLGAYLTGAIAERGKVSLKTYFLAGAAHIASVYTLGVIYFYIISRFYLGNVPTIAGLLVSCCLVFLPGDLASCALGAVAAKRLRPVLGRYLL